MSAWAERMLIPVLVCLGSYAAGCLVGAYYLVRWRTGKDLRALGSGNPGATNAGRVLGRSGFALALLVDAGKGSVVTASARALGAGSALLGVAMVAVVAGHVWPAQLGFRGGKGAATALGLLAVYDLRVAAVLLVCLGLLYAVTRRLDASGLPTLGLAPFAAGMLGKDAAAVTALAAVAAIVYWAHFARRTA